MKVFLVILILALATPVFAVTVDEGNYLKYQLEIEKLVKQRNNLITAKDAELLQSDIDHQAANQVIIDTHQGDINAKQVEIDTMRSNLDNLIGK